MDKNQATYESVLGDDVSISHGGNRNEAKIEEIYHRRDPIAARETKAPVVRLVN